MAPKAKTVDNLRALNAHLVTQISDLRKQIEVLKESNSLLESSLSEIRREEDKMGVEADEVNKSLIKEIERLEEEFSGFLRDGKIASLLEELKVEKNTVVSDIKAEIEKEKKGLVEQITGLEKNIVALSEANGIMLRQIADLREEKETLVGESKTMWGMKKKAEEEKNEAGNELQRIKSEFLGLVGEKAMVDSRLAELVEERIEVEGELQRARAEMQALMVEKATMDTRLAEMSNLKENSEVEKVMAERRLAEMEEEIVNVERDLEERIHSLKEMKTIINEYEQLNHEQKIEINKLHQDARIGKKAFWVVVSAAVAFVAHLAYKVIFHS